MRITALTSCGNVVVHPITPCHEVQFVSRTPQQEIQERQATDGSARLPPIAGGEGRQEQRLLLASDAFLTRTVTRIIKRWGIVNAIQLFSSELSYWLPFFSERFL